MYSIRMINNDGKRVYSNKNIILSREDIDKNFSMSDFFMSIEDARKLYAFLIHRKSESFKSIAIILMSATTPSFEKEVVEFRE